MSLEDVRIAGNNLGEFFKLLSELETAMNNLSQWLSSAPGKEKKQKMVGALMDNGAPTWAKLISETDNAIKAVSSVD